MVVVLFPRKCIEYNVYMHPESPERVLNAYNILDGKFLIEEPKILIKDSNILCVHTKEHINNLKNLKFHDVDTPRIKNIYFYAMISASSSLCAMLKSKYEFTFSLSRPPGHHAGKNSIEGFCYLNNIAIAVFHALKTFAKRVAILDIDAHHGNGTENIFYGKDNILYVSLHQHPLYPGTGLKSRKNCINFPMPPGTGEKEYIKKLKIAMKIVEEFNPDILAISAGFDTYKNDPLASFKLETKSYYKIAKIIGKSCPRIFAILEGGYSDNLGVLIYNFLKGFEIY